MNPTKRTSIALTALAAAAAIGPSSAAASKLVTYDVQVDSTTSYNLVQQTRDDLSSWNAFDRFSWHEAADLQRVQFLDGYLVHGATAKGYSNAQGRAESVMTRKGSPTQSGSCDVDLDAHGEPSVKLGKPDGAPVRDESIAVTVSDDDIGLDWNCEGYIGNYTHQFGSKPIDPEGDFGQRPMDATFTIPREAVGFGKIIQQIHGPDGRSKGYCPEDYEVGVTKCEFGWDGEVTFTKVGEQTIGEVPTTPEQLEQLAPLVRPAATELEELAPLIPVQSKALTDAKASAVSFTAQCPAGCSGTAALTIAAAKGAAASAAAKPVARMRFKVKASKKAQKVRLKLPAKARRALKRAGRGSLRVTITKPGTKAASRTLKVKVPRR